MSINVTPIPRLIDLAAPAFTLGTANAAGSAATAVASDSTLLAFDTTDPAAVAASAVVGSATVAARRDHVHPGTTGAGTVVDDAITRFNGTGGSSLQGYSSLSPTISDAGIISLTSGALKFPATQIASTDANTLDDYEAGTWTPALAGASGGTATYAGAGQTGRYVKIGQMVFLMFQMELSGLGSLTTSDNAKIVGLPFTQENVSGLILGPVWTVSGITSSTAGRAVGSSFSHGDVEIHVMWYDLATGAGHMTIAEVGGGAKFLGTLQYKATQ